MSATGNASGGPGDLGGPDPQGPRYINVAGRRFRVPASRWVRVVIGLALVFGGFLGFLPILGFWMLPLGLLILSVDLPPVRRLRRRLEVRYGRWRNGRAAARNGRWG